MTIGLIVLCGLIAVVFAVGIHIWKEARRNPFLGKEWEDDL